MRKALPSTFVRVCEWLGAAAGSIVDRIERALERTRFANWTIAARLASIVVALAVPLNLGVLAVIWHLIGAAGEAQRTSLTYTARSVAAGVDAQLGKFMILAEVLSRSPSLLSGDIAAFEVETRRTLAHISDAWVIVGAPDGRQLLNSARPTGHPLPALAPEELAAQARALDTRAPVISGVYRGPVTGRWVVSIDIPVFRNGTAILTLAIKIEVRNFMRLLNAQEMPRYWLAGIIDESGQFIARVPDSDRLTGQSTTERARETVRREGIFNIRSMEGHDTTTAVAHSTLSNWAIAIAANKAELDSAAWSTARWAMLLGGILSVMTLLVAFAIARRITRPIADLRRQALSGFGVPEPEAVLGPPEIGELRRAIGDAVKERDRSELALRESEERLRLTNEAAGIGTFLVDLVKGEVTYSPDLADMLGFPNVRSTPLELAFARVHRENVEHVRKMFAKAQDTSGDGRLRMELRFVRPGGDVRWMTWNGKVEFVSSETGRKPVRVLGACVDITDRKLAEDATARLAAIVTSSSDAIISKSMEGVVRTWNPGAAKLFGYDEQEMIGQSIRRLIPDDRQDEETDILTRISAGEWIENYDTVRVSKSGRKIDVSVSSSPIRDSTGKIVAASKIVRDITERKAAAEQVQLLLREVNHRAKNMLSLVQAIARQTTASTPNDFVRRFAERIQALSANQDLLVRNEWRGVDLEDLVRAQLAHFDDLIGTRIRIDGPKLELTAAAAQGIGMALHELATNAGKYGALSTAAGRLEFVWRLEDGNLVLLWTERGGPPVEPPRRQGFGTTVIAAMAKASVDGDVQLQYEKSGLRWRLECPASEALGDSSNGIRSGG